MRIRDHRQSPLITILRHCVALLLAVTGAGNAAANPPDFETEIAPLLVRRCVECHQGKAPSGSLLLTSRAGLQAGGDSGPAVDLQQVDESYLLHRVLSGDMPPPEQGRMRRLPEEEIELLRRWIDAGAAWPEDRTLNYFERTSDTRAGRDWWSLQPVVRPEVPQRATASASGHPIDAFIRTRLHAADILPAPIADRRTLIRRVYYDLIGLPPTEAEIAAFLQDHSPDAWERLIDRLLAMPQYGERWGRYWLDLARYADTSGYERDQEKPYAWKYRDWVVQALNDDMPYDRFLIEQLAGDELADRDEQSVIATGFLRLGTWNDEPNDPADYQYDRLEDLVHTTSSAMLALTVKCARCHEHKFDAIRQEDYYRMASVFWPGPVSPGRARDALGGPTEDELGFSEVLAWTDVDVARAPLQVLQNGERHQPLYPVEPATLSFVPALERALDEPPPGAESTRRRLQLAHWIADVRNPLTYRVIVNRIWQHHFGKGIVRTPNNFGFLADPPTHPELLDWLTAEFTAGGMRMKPLHRLILTSETWRQSSRHPDEEQIADVDSGNRMWWRAERRRLDSEALRDSLLSVSGELDLTVGGPGFRPTMSSAVLEGLSMKSSAWQASPARDQNRRSIYTFLKRGLLPPIMTTFDLADPTLSCGRRDVTTVPTQALTLLNNDFVHGRSRHLAESICREHNGKDDRLRAVWSRVLQRPPDSDERALSLQHVARQQEILAASPPPQQAADADAESGAPSLVLHLRADQVQHNPAAGVAAVTDLSPAGHGILQADAEARPTLNSAGWNGHPTLSFNGVNQYLTIEGTLLENAQCTIICVLSDQDESGHRAILSNWNGAAGNSTSSLFLGLTDSNTIRFSDALPAAGTIAEGTQPFLLTAINGNDHATLFQNGRLLAEHPAIRERRLDTAWVIGQQGNINGEFWEGEIAEIRVYDRPLTRAERQQVEQELATRYAIPHDESPPPTVFSPDVLAWASLCHVLMNSNEFIYID